MISTYQELDNLQSQIINLESMEQGGHNQQQIDPATKAKTWIPKKFISVRENKKLSTQNIGPKVIFWFFLNEIELWKCSKNW